jgi:hypothetical protein
MRQKITKLMAIILTCTILLGVGGVQGLTR